MEQLDSEAIAFSGLPSGASSSLNILKSEIYELKPMSALPHRQGKP